MIKIKFGASCVGMNQKYEDEFEVDDNISDKEIEILVKEAAIEATHFEFWWKKLNNSTDEAKIREMICFKLTNQ